MKTPKFASFESLASLFLAGSFVLISGCGSRPPAAEGVSDQYQSMLESVLSQANSIANYTEGQTAPGLAEASKSLTSPPLRAAGIANCAYPATSTCSNGILNLSWTGCGFANSAGSLLGTGEYVFYSGGSVSNAATFQASISLGAQSNAVCSSPSWTTAGTAVAFLPNAMTYTFDSAATIVMDTQNVSSYKPVNSAPITFPNAAVAGVTVTYDGTARQIVFNGIEQKIFGPQGVLWSDHIITGGLSVTGTRQGASPNRVINGETTTYSVVASVVGKNTFSNVTWAAAKCCYPTKGTITTQISRSTDNFTETLVLDFSNYNNPLLPLPDKSDPNYPNRPQCGTASLWVNNYNVAGAVPQIVTLGECF